MSELIRDIGWAYYRAKATWCQARIWDSRVEVFWCGRWETPEEPKTMDPALRQDITEMFGRWRKAGRPYPSPWQDLSWA